MSILPFTILHLPSPPLRPLLRHSSSRSPSSSRYLSRQQSDPFSKSKSHYVSRSAHKLLELQKASHNTLLRPGMIIVDLGAAPGGWSQAAIEEISRGLGKGRGKWEGGLGRGRVVAVDLLPLHQSVRELEGVEEVTGDFLKMDTRARVVGCVGGEGKVDLVLSDMLCNVSGNREKDDAGCLDLCRAVVGFAVKYLKPPLPSPPPSPPSPPPSLSTLPSPKPKKLSFPPSLIIKYLQSQSSTEFQHQVLQKYFRKVRCEKPESSRPESRECYWVCEGFLGEGDEVVEGKEEGKEEEGLFFWAFRDWLICDGCCGKGDNDCWTFMYVLLLEFLVFPSDFTTPVHNAHPSHRPFVDDVRSTYLSFPLW